MVESNRVLSTFNILLVWNLEELVPADFYFYIVIFDFLLCYSCLGVLVTFQIQTYKIKNI